MIAPPQRPQFRLGTYDNGQPYVVPRGRYAPRGWPGQFLGARVLVVLFRQSKGRTELRLMIDNC